MKQLLSIFCVMLSAFVAAAAGPVSATNGHLTATYENGIVTITTPGLETPVATITTGLKSDTLKAEAVSHPKQKFNLLTLRGPEGSVAFKIEGTCASFTIAYNRSASPITVNWNASAVVLPDVFAEDEVLLPDRTERRLPPFVPLYLALLGNGEATLACIPVKAKSAAVLSADLKTLTINSKNNEDYIFVLNAAPGAWHRTALPVRPGEFKILEDWQPPYPALWRAAMPVEQDFIPIGNGSWSVWNIITVTGKGNPTDLPPRAVMTNRETRRTWNGGFEDSYRYPAEFLDGKAKLVHPSFRGRIVHDLKRPVCIYAWQQGQHPDAPMPEKFLPPWVSSIKIHRSTNTTYGMLATTCNVTALFEKIFYRGEAALKTAEIAAMLKSMQCFVESIRGRIESGREWRLEMLKLAARWKTLYPALAIETDKLATAVNEIEHFYELDRKRIKFPTDVEALGQRVLKLAASGLDNETKEEEAKKLGRAIRAIGGTQDNLVAKFRHVGKCVRRMALIGYMTAQSPEAAEFWGEVYHRTEPLLQGYYGHDGK